MTELYRFTHDAFRWLLDNIEKNKAYYRDPEADFAKLLQDNGIDEYSSPTGITINGKLHMKPLAGEGTHRRHLADHQSLDFYNALKGMTPRLATEPEILAYINHMHLHEYGIWRWPHRGATTLVANIQYHWLTESAQRTGMHKASIASRTWWLAHMATRAAESSNGAFDAKQAQNVFANNPEYYHRTMEYAVLRNPATMSE